MFNFHHVLYCVAFQKVLNSKAQRSNFDSLTQSLGLRPIIVDIYTKTVSYNTSLLSELSRIFLPSSSSSSFPPSSSSPLLNTVTSHLDFAL